MANFDCRPTDRFLTHSLLDGTNGRRWKNEMEQVTLPSRRYWQLDARWYVLFMLLINNVSNQLQPTMLVALLRCPSLLRQRCITKTTMMTYLPLLGLIHQRRVRA